MLAAHARLEAELNDLGTFGRGTLTIGIPPMGGTLFTPAIAAFRQRYPKVELKLFERGSKAIEAALLDGEMELGGVLQPVDLAHVRRDARQPAVAVARRAKGFAVGPRKPKSRSPISPPNFSFSMAKASR